jgi:hypothetical protein
VGEPAAVGAAVAVDDGAVAVAEVAARVAPAVGALV